MKRFDIFLYLILVFLCAGCSKKVEKKEDEKKFSPVKEYLETADEKITRDLLEAKLADIPLPFSLELIESFTAVDDEKNQIIVSYQTEVNDMQELKVFYEKEMERFGWQEVHYFEAKELLLTFDRPGKLCVVSIRPENDKKTTLILFIGEQEYI